ncbi:phosphopantetheine-binding protein [Streptomyces sp. R-74717]|uniref:phosphopantetheine-binding protein n=1 Tax=Streptomyces TaxID=1883 RepID=UPI00225BB132|nr:phosphopantetheine-binding protein [Streptomyces atratus]MCX5340146.1 phosphopantetheine-binding protein [Streptomyces atratus]
MDSNDYELAGVVRKLMTDVLDLRLSPEEIKDGMSLYSPTIQLDSLNLLQLLLAVEDEFGGHIDDEDVMEADLETVGDLIGLVSRHVRENRSEAGA